MEKQRSEGQPSEISKLIRAILADRSGLEELRAAIVQPEIQLIQLSEVARISSLSKSEIWRRVRANTFPQPVKIGEGEEGEKFNRCTRWSLCEVNAWVTTRLATRRARSADAVATSAQLAA